MHHLRAIGPSAVLALQRLRPAPLSPFGAAVVRFLDVIGIYVRVMSSTWAHDLTCADPTMMHLMNG